METVTSNKQVKSDAMKKNFAKTFMSYMQHSIYNSFKRYVHVYICYA